MSLQNLSQVFPTINNPYISKAYLDHQFSAAGNPEEVLVIETNIKLNKAKPGSSDYERLNDLLLALDDVQALVESKGGNFDYVDIRSTADTTTH